MEGKMLYIGISVILAMSLVGCQPNASGVRKEAGNPAVQQAPTNVMPTASATEISHAIPTDDTMNTNVAPSYEEIQNMIQGLRAKYGSSDEAKRELEQFYHSLEGKKVQAWQGWVSITIPNKEQFYELTDPVDPYLFDVWIYMSCSRGSDCNPPYTEVILTDVSLEQVAMLDTWHNPIVSGDLNLQKVEFSGVIGLIDPGPPILINHAEVKPADY